MLATEIGILVTGIISGLDLLVNGFALCMSGSCSIKCCGSEVTHQDTEAELVDLTRRMSVPKNRTTNDEDDKSENK